MQKVYEQLTGIVALCDGNRSLIDIHAAIREKRSDLDYDAFKRQFDEFCPVSAHFVFDARLAKNSRDAWAR